LLEWEAVFKVVTPLFLGGANPEEEEKLSIRAPSIKGALRFWYRAIALGRLGSLEKVRGEEARLFGSTGTGQSAFLLRVEGGDLKTVRKGKIVSNGNAYLGYGVATWNRDVRANLTVRPYIEPGRPFKLKLLFTPNNKAKQSFADLKLSIIALGLFGGLGARSRRGFGSLALMSLKENGRIIWSAPQTVDELRLKYVEFFQELSLPEKEELPEYTAFSRYSRIAIVDTDINAEQLHNKIGEAMNKHRSYRKDRNYPRDHDIAWEVAGPNKPEEHPARLAFGLPHNYFFLSNKSRKINVSVSGQKNREEYRRASPLFIHIHPVGKEFAAVFTFMPAKFLPEGVKIFMNAEKVMGRNHKQPLGEAKVPCEITSYGDFHPITDFMDSFPCRMEVKVSE
jgi:CRISPR-associated protein Cmr1